MYVLHVEAGLMGNRNMASPVMLELVQPGITKVIFGFLIYIYIYVCDPRSKAWSSGPV